MRCGHAGVVCDAQPELRCEGLLTGEMDGGTWRASVMRCSSFMGGSAGLGIPNPPQVCSEVSPSGGCSPANRNEHVGMSFDISSCCLACCLRLSGDETSSQVVVLTLLASLVPRLSSVASCRTSPSGGCLLTSCSDHVSEQKGVAHTAGPDVPGSDG